eukprot:COSAG02_NODE_38280_length_431_cov_0.542169_1_plen_76_part_10
MPLVTPPPPSPNIHPGRPCCSYGASKSNILTCVCVSFATVFVSTASARAQGEVRQPLAEFAKANQGFMLHPNQVIS